MMKLSDREWKAFKIKDLFYCYTGKYYSKNKYSNGNTPLITAKSQCNGISRWININDEDYFENAITIGKVDAASFYQPFGFVCSSDVNVIKPKDVKLNKYIACFLCNQIMMQSSKFDYGNQIRLNDTKALNLMLPSIDNKPDYEFMEQYIKEKYFNLKSQIKEKQKHEITDWRGLDEVEWMDFQINKLFYNKIGKNIDGNKIDKQNGKVPYVTRKESNNGLDGFVYNDKCIEEKLNISQNPVITIGNETAKPFVQNYDFFTGTKVNILQPIATNNIFSLRFISKMLEQQKKKYSYSFTINSRRLKKQTIKLPTKNNQPDYKFMEQYMKRKENEILDRI
ncbi:restriction endonuclease subunit S [Staphylococcus pettenkoferi]|uniref:restriction endonuclease subunit S n=1 Tax=Staphylococcus pettenkoferi TaxID=170573 RepID=UPI0022764079|nr:restriction endonuclease subunit S [Staphylococcus pettenkoferi]MCY1615488.1 restriction endonuclease subunit S [Staphylococcus pettenkoferi]